MINQKQNIETTELIKQCLKNKPWAQRKLYDQYAQAMFNSLVRMSGNKEIAKDVLQESFIKVFKNLGQFKSNSTLGAWIKKICINTMITELGKPKFQSLEEVDLLDESEVKIDFTKEVEAIHHAIKELPKGSRMVLNLFLLEGMSHEEIAQILQISVSTSKSQYHRAKKILREKLQTERNEAG